jgi:branched-chain amino acid transport system permease protein
MTPAGLPPLRLAALVAMVLWLGGCAAVVDRDRITLCRQLLPLMAPADATLRVEERRVEGAMVGFRYRATTPEGRTQARQLACRFAPEALGAARLDIIAVVADGRPVPMASLLLLKRFWLPSVEATLADPGEPLRTEGLPQLSRPMAVAMQHVLASLPTIAIYLMLAPAYALIYGLIGRINLAFGELAALGAMGAAIGVVAAQWAGVPLGLAAAMVAILAAMAVAVTHGEAIGRLVFVPLAGRPGQQVLVATLGLSVALQEYMRLTQGAAVRWLPPLWNETIPLARAGDFVVTVTPIAGGMALLSALLAVLLLLLLKRSRFGRQWRAVADDRLAAALFGVSSDRVLALAFTLSAGLAAVAGAVMALHYGGVGFAGGTLLGLKALVGAILGGIGSVPGAMLGALVLGLGEALWSALLPIAYRDVAIFAFLSLLLALRPGGLLGFAEPTPRQV